MVTQALSKPLTLEEFLAWYPEDGRRYELIEGEIVEMRPVGQAVWQVWQDVRLATQRWWGR
jgi:Uma2 family endonuclease